MESDDSEESLFDDFADELPIKDVPVLFREKEKEFLVNFFVPNKQYPSLFIYGHTATGKTLLVSKLMSEFCLPYAWVNCREICTSQFIFNSIAHQLLINDEFSDVKCCNTCEFVNFLRNILENKNETTYLVFDNAEVLRKEDPFLLSILTGIQYMTRVNICSIFISELPWIKFKNHTSTFDPVSLHFRNYTKSEICEILISDCPAAHTQSFYAGYVNVILKTFFTVTRNLLELRHLAHIHFEKYCEPLENPDGEPSSLRLWKNIEPTLKEAMRSVYLREISGSKWKIHCKAKNEPSSSTFKIAPLSCARLSMTRELPFYSKFLLISAYFASYNPPKTDFKHFVKNQGKQKKKRITRKVEKNRHLLGPKPFTLDRMLSIFFSIVGERVLPSALIFSQITSLVTMRLLSRVSTDEVLDCPKYKCLAELELVQNIGKTVKIDVMGYLDDFL